MFFEYDPYPYLKRVVFSAYFQVLFSLLVAVGGALQRCQTFLPELEDQRVSALVTVPQGRLRPRNKRGVGPWVVFIGGVAGGVYIYSK